MKQYVDLVNKILKKGNLKEDRTGVGTKSIFGHQSVYDMQDGFPLLTLKKTMYKGVFHELLWFLNSVPEEYKKFGNTNIKYLVDNNVNIWNEWPFENYKKKVKENGYNFAKQFFRDLDEPLTLKGFVNSIKKSDEFAEIFGDLGPVYGKQWINWQGFEHGFAKGLNDKEDLSGINQISNIIDILKNNPDSRRILVNAWNVSEIESMLLPPCHIIFQFYSYELSKKERLSLFNSKMRDMGWDMRSIDDIRDEEFIHFDIPARKLDLQLYQRSMDVGLGCPFNIASYSLLLHMICQIVGMAPGKFIHTVGDAHIYKNHFDQMNTMLDRVSSYKGGGKYYGPALPQIKLNTKIKDIQAFRIDDIEIMDYNPLPFIKMPVAV